MGNRILRIAVAVLSALLMSACGSTLFRANFDADAVGARPPETPAGEPVGDYFYMSAPAGVASPAIVVTDAAFSGRALRYRNNDVEAWYRYIGFMSKEVTPASENYWAIWRGRPDLPDGVSALDVWFGNSHFLPMLSLRLANGQVRLRTSDDPSTYETIGSYESGQLHTVLMRVNKLTSRYSVSIISRAGSVHTGSRPVLNASAVSTLRPTMYMWFSDAVSSAGSYTLDDIRITESCPVSGSDLITQGTCEAM
jgi:hypothetical protein